MTPEMLDVVASKLFGPNWKNPLATAIFTHHRTLRRWANGDVPIPAFVGKSIALLARIKIGALERDLDRFQQISAPQRDIDWVLREIDETRAMIEWLERD